MARAALSPSKRQLWETQDFHPHVSNSTFLEWESRSPFRNRISSRIPGFFGAERRERRSRPPDANSGRGRIPILSSQTRLFLNGSHALHSEVEFHSVCRVFWRRTARAALSPSKRQLWERQDFHPQLSNSTFWNGSHALHSEIEIRRVFPAFLGVERRERRSRLPNANSGRGRISILISQTGNFE